MALFASASLLRGERNFILHEEAFRTKYITGGKVGLRGTFDLSDEWALEFGYRYGNNNLHITEELGTPHAERRTFGIRQHGISATVLRFLNKRRERIGVFIMAGIGLVRFSPTEEARAEAAVEFVNNPSRDVRAENKRSFHVGTGVEAALTSRWGFRIQVQDHIMGIPRFGLAKSSPGDNTDFFPVSGVVHNIEPSVGLVYRWGR